MAKSTKTAGTAKKAAPGIKRAAARTVFKDDETALKELFLDELRDIYWAEKHLTKALPRMRKAATSEELANAFEQHLSVTEGQIERLEEAFELLEVKAKAIKCEGMEGLVKESERVIEETQKGSSTRDAGLIIAAQKVEHYEIAAYGSIVQLARTMGREDIANLLQQTLDEEKQADQLLTELAVSGINISAENEPEEGDEE